jgi:hypothetical protein
VGLCLNNKETSSEKKVALQFRQPKVSIGVSAFGSIPSPSMCCSIISEAITFTITSTCGTHAFVPPIKHGQAILVCIIDLINLPIQTQIKAPPVSYVLTGGAFICVSV